MSERHLRSDACFHVSVLVLALLCGLGCKKDVSVYSDFASTCRELHQQLDPGDKRYRPSLRPALVEFESQLSRIEISSDRDVELSSLASGVHRAAMSLEHAWKGGLRMPEQEVAALRAATTAFLRAYDAER